MPPWVARWRFLMVGMVSAIDFSLPLTPSTLNVLVLLVSMGLVMSTGASGFNP